jgi:hypothetical protein
VYGPVLIDDRHYPDDETWHGSLAIADSLGER